MAKECEVCFGTPGWYPIINRFGQQLYQIKCPECFGSGEIEEETQPVARPQTGFKGRDLFGIKY